MDINGVPQAYCSTKIVFILFGVASLLGWNALLTELDFFFLFLKSMNPYVSFGFLNYILNILFQFVLVWKKDILPMKLQLIISIIGSIAFLILIPMFTMILENDSLFNRIFTGSLVVLMGLINALCSGGFFSLVSNFPLEMIVSLSAGQGFSGIAMNIMKYIVLVSIPFDEKSKDIKEKERIYSIRAWIFFGVSSFILLICLILLLISYNTSYFQYYLNKAKDKNATPGVENRTTEEENPKEEKLNFVEEPSIPQLEGNNATATFRYLFSKLWDLDFLILYIYIVTFALFPNASINQKLFKLEGSFKSNTIILTYNLFDTIGRYLVSKVKPSKKLNMFVIIGRSILLFTLIFNYFCQEQIEENESHLITSISLLINVALLAATNGIGTTLCFGIAPNEVEDAYKGQAGGSLSFFLIFGIFLGNCVAFGTDAIIRTFKKE